MTGFTMLGVATFVILGSLLFGALIAGAATYGNEMFYPTMFFISWMITSIFLILELVGK